MRSAGIVTNTVDRIMGIIFRCTINYSLRIISLLSAPVSNGTAVYLLRPEPLFFESLCT